MKYYQNFSSQSDPKKLAEMLAMQEANQRIDTDYGEIPSMSGGQIDFDTMKRMAEGGKELRKKIETAKNKKIGEKTYSTTTPLPTEGLA